MGILIVVGVFIFVVVIILAGNTQKKKADAESIDKAADILRRIGYADRKAITEDWEKLKGVETKWIICKAWEKVFDEFTVQGKTEAANFLVYCVGDEIMKYLKELADFYQKADEEAHKWM